MTKKENDLVEDQEIDEDEEEIEGDEPDKEEKAEEEPDPTDPPEETEDDPEREAIRERRKRERKLRKERDRRERLELKNTVTILQKKLEETEKKFSNVETTLTTQDTQRIESELAETNRTYYQAQDLMKTAIAENDGEKFARAKEIGDRAFARFHELNGLKQQRQPKKEIEETRQEQPKNDFDPQVQRLAKDWAAKHTWFRLDSDDDDAVIVKSLDAKLMAEGYDPADQDYWDELTDRTRKYLPHRFKRAATPNIVGGGGGASSSSDAKTLPKEFVDMVKRAGYWDDPKQRKAAIAEFNANRKGAR